MHLFFQENIDQNVNCKQKQLIDFNFTPILGSCCQNSKMMRRLPVVVILGSTGTGKTKLSLELAKKFNGEIISADSMQVYTGLDIVSAKATKTEQASAKHHLLDVAQPGVLYSVKLFQESALPIVERVLDEEKLPIIVGGTNYYIESLLWKILVDEWEGAADCDVTSPKRIKLREERLFEGQDMTNIESNVLHEKLKQIDPEIANRLHPNNKRKIIRALEVYENSGRLFSDFIRDQKLESGGSDYGGPLRYKNLVLLWLTCDQEILNQRLDKRVDGMVKEGLLCEIREFHRSFIKPFGDQLDYTKGILQTIGFKEFLPYLEKFDETEDNTIVNYLNDPSEAEAPQSMQTLNDCLDQLKLVTKRYSKKQLKWVKNRFLNASQRNREIPPIYKLDSSHPERWDEVVLSPSINVIENAVDSNFKLKYCPETQITEGQIWNREVTNFCEICQKTFVGEFQWTSHMKSNRHKRVLAKKHRDAKRNLEMSTT